MDNNYKVVYIGALKAGTDEEQFVHGFMQLFKAPEAQARKLVSIGRAITLKDNLDQPTAEKYRQAMDKLGMQVHVENTASEPSAFNSASAPPSQQPQNSTPDTTVRCPKCGSERVRGDDCLACGIIISRYRERQAQMAETMPHHDNPYAAPQSDVTAVHSPDPDQISGPHSMPAGNGWQWIASGWRHFIKNPFAWIGAIIVWIVLIIGSSLIPLLGSLVLNLLGPVFAAGFLLGADEQRKGGNFEVGHLFSGFSNNTGKLVVVGLLNLLGTVAIFAIAALLLGGALAGMKEDLQSGNLQAMMTFAVPLLLMLALWMLLVMAYWFAPALVALEGVSPINAMKLSFSACLKNILPSLVCTIIMGLLMIVAVIPFGLGLFIMVPVMMATIYTSYRDIFYEAA